MNRAHVLNNSTQEAKASLRPVWSTKWVPDSAPKSKRNSKDFLWLNVFPQTNVITWKGSDSRGGHLTEGEKPLAKGLQKVVQSLPALGHVWTEHLSPLEDSNEAPSWKESLRHYKTQNLSMPWSWIVLSSRTVAVTLSLYISWSHKFSDRDKKKTDLKRDMGHIYALWH